MSCKQYLHGSILRKNNVPGNKTNTAKPDSLAPESSCVFPPVSRQTAITCFNYCLQRFLKRPMKAMNFSGNMYPPYNLITA